MKPVLAFPFTDPDGTMFPHLQAILSDLKSYFDHAYICPPLSTLENKENIEQLQADDFFTIFRVDREMQIGEHFAYLYRRAAQAEHPERIVHLAYVDRLAFALEGQYREAFLADVDSLTNQDVPVIFQRSQTAWETHPQNYRELEGMVTTVGCNLFGRELDYAWCHIALTAGQLREIMPRVKNPDLSMVAEMIFYMQAEVKTRDVDWLSWEDPFLLNRDAAKLKQERENSLEEIRKRLRYVRPMIETLTRLARTETVEAGKP
ncbi:MAG TPA: hypothetical protein VFY26_00130 [Anaerolineales bacterium]|nr:hypothetical protein [Anaerolineales bacterium]